MKITFSPLSLEKTDTLVLGVAADKTLSYSGKAIDKELKSFLSRAISASSFDGKLGAVLLLPTPAGAKFNRIAILGLGKAKELTDLTARRAGGSLQVALDKAGVKQTRVVVELPKGCSLSNAELASELAYGALLKSYRFDKYHTKKPADQRAQLNALTFLCDMPRNAQKLFANYSALADGIFYTRDLVSEPANVIYPETLAAKCKELSKLGVEVEVLGEAQMKKLGMGALLGVGQGSERESQLAIMRWNGGTKNETPLAFVGKGVTFDTGGISIKPAGGMEDMKWDMGGAGTVIGLMRALANRKAKVNVVGVVGLVENMPDGNAQRPGDVVTTMSGQTVEVINTDAEGRLVLADALWYTQNRFKPKFMVDLATLTGAIIVSLGKSRAGLFSNNEKLAKQLATAGDYEGELLWRMPLGGEYANHIDSDIADMKNVGKSGQAGSISAAEFLHRYVNDVPWAHLDIAGVAWSTEDGHTFRKGATGFGIRLLNRFIADNYEK